MQWSTQQVTNNTYNSTDRPAIINTGSSLFLAYKGASGDTAIYYAQNSSGAWGPLTVARGSDGIVFGTSFAPALTLLGNSILMTWMGSGDTHVWYSQYDLATGTWTPQTICTGSDGIVFGTSLSPSLASLGGKAFMAWKGQGSDTRIWTSTYDPAASGGNWSPQTVLAGSDGVVFGTSAKPAAVEYFGSLFLAWMGSGDTHLWYSVYDPTTKQWSPQAFAQYDGAAFGTSDGPALVTMGTSILMTWKGVSGDSRIWQSATSLPAVSWQNQAIAAGANSVQFGTSFGPALAQTPAGPLMVWRGSGDTFIWTSALSSAISGTYNGGNWMSWAASQSGSAFSTKGIGEMMMVGTHDAGMYVTLDVSVLGKTQDQTIFEQLSAGVRYFDLRVAYAGDLDGNYFFQIVHGPIPGPLFAEVLNDVRSFMSVPGCREVAVLKLSHMSISTDAYDQLVTMITSSIGSWLYRNPGPGRLAGIPYDALTADGNGKVIVVVDGAYAVNSSTSGIYVYRDATLTDPAALKQGDLIVYDAYSDTTDYRAMSTDQIAKFRNYTGICSDGQTPSDMFLLSWTLTPWTGVWWWAQQANANFLNDFAQAVVVPNSHGKLPNVIYLDYHEYAGALDYVVESNLRNP